MPKLTTGLPIETPLAEAANFDYEALWQSSAAEVGELVEQMQEDWVEGNPYYERMEGIVGDI